MAMCRPIPKNQRSAAGATPPQTLKRKAKHESKVG